MFTKNEIDRYVVYMYLRPYDGIRKFRAKEESAF